MTYIHKSKSNKTECYKFWKDRIIETRCRINRGHLTILGSCAPTEGSEESNEEFYEMLQNVRDKVNKVDCIMLIGDLNARIGNKKSLI
jgi:hypothetical protein